MTNIKFNTEDSYVYKIKKSYPELIKVAVITLNQPENTGRLVLFYNISTAFSSCLFEI